MRREEAREAVLGALRRVAPDLDVTGLEDDQLLHDLELDSMDFLGLVTALSEETGIVIPDIDLPQLITVAAAVDYLVRRSRAAVDGDGTG